MRKKAAVILCSILLSFANGFVTPVPGNTIKTDAVTITIEQQHKVVQPGVESALAVRFELKEDWHFYASGKTAPGGMNLKLKPSAEEEYISFSEPIFPQPRDYFDEFSSQKLGVFSDKFTVFLPFSVEPVLFEANEPADVGINIGIEGAVCSKMQCRMPDFGQLSTDIRIIPFLEGGMGEPRFVLPDLSKAAPSGGPTTTGQWASYSVLGALVLAFLAGLSLNIMPCVWPVLPIIVMRIVEQSKESKGKSMVLGLTFCLGILLFFVCLATANIILQLFYGTVLQWGDQFRNPAFIMGMALLLIVLALFMFGLFTIVLPSSVTGKSGSGKGYFGAVGMGFLAAILSTPCSFAILATAFAWAQAQPLPLGTVAIMFIGIGMSVPYAILTSVPGLLKHIPKPGQWMELFKQAIGFVLLIIAVKLIAALPQVRRTDVLYFAVVLSFCIWMWGGWVSYSTKPLRKWLIRIIAIALAIFAGWVFLPAPPGELIDWQKYDSVSIESALSRGQPVLIKFTADWCLVCQAVDKIVYSREDIAKLIEQKDVLAIKADTTANNYPATLALKNTYNEPGVPVTMLFTQSKKEPIRWRNMFFTDELKEQLGKLSGE
ncbi:MAG: protein-disulfide reductase DsbD family protein [Planctomycetota bacterium]|jgi:cytochrome c biogenesis protein CcdA